MATISRSFKEVLKPRIGKNEKVVGFAFKSKWLYVLPFFLCLIFVFVMLGVNNLYGYLYQDISEDSTKLYLLIFFAGLVFFLGWSILMFIRRKSIEIAITTRKVVVFEGLFPVEIEYSALEDCSASKFGLGAFFNYGKITFYSKMGVTSSSIYNTRRANASNNMTYYGINDVQYYYKLVMKAVNRYEEKMEAARAKQREKEREYFSKKLAEKKKKKKLEVKKKLKKRSDD
jgi:hypothetical protein